MSGEGKLSMQYTVLAERQYSAVYSVLAKTHYVLANMQVDRYASQLKSYRKRELSKLLHCIVLLIPID